MEKNKIYSGIVSGLGTGGEGIINSEGTTAFVPFCLTGEKTRFKALKVKDGVCYGKIEEILSPSSDRVAPPCPVFGKCGGCDIQHMTYQAQLKFKKGVVENALKKIGGISAEVDETVPCESRLRYRNKLTLPIGTDGSGKTVLGFYAPHSHRIVPVNDCLIQSEWVKQVISAIEKFARENKLNGYDEEKKTGVLRRISVRELKGKFIFALVVTKTISVEPLLKELEKHFAEFTFLLNINSSRSNAVFGKEWRICRGEGFFEAEENGVKYKAGAQTFIQINDGVRAKLYARILDSVDKECIALDLYSGGGLLTAMLAKKCAAAYGVEIVEEASRCAEELKTANGLQGKMHNICGAVEDKIKEIFSLTEGKKRVIVCDPPRKGMERSVVHAIAQSGADMVILVSCNPATLARDLGILTGTLTGENGELKKFSEKSDGAYSITSVTPFDMFPQTKHVETLVCLKQTKMTK